MQTPEREPRSAVFFVATLIMSTGELEVKVKNYSEGGAYVSLPGGVRLMNGEKGVLVRNDLKVEFTVAWEKDGEAGLKFKAPIKKEKILEKRVDPFEGLKLPQRVFDNPEYHKRSALRSRP